MHLFIKCARLHHALVEQRVSALGLHRSQHSALLAASRFDGISQKQLSDEMEISPAAVTVTLKKLENQGLVKKLQSPDDSRTNRVSVTSKGRELIIKTSEIFDEVDRGTFNGFTDDEIAVLTGYLERVSDNLKKSCESADDRRELSI